jgi:hypothetical protein
VDLTFPFNGLVELCARLDVASDWFKTCRTSWNAKRSFGKQVGFTFGLIVFLFVYVHEIFRACPEASSFTVALKMSPLELGHPIAIFCAAA